MITDYGVRVIRAYENRRVGNVFYPPGLLRDSLVQRGLVERVSPPAVKPRSETLDRAIRPNRHRGE